MSKKSKRVVCLFAIERVHAFIDEFVALFGVSADLELILGYKSKVVMSTDSKQLFDAMVKGKHTTERRLMADVVAARHLYKRFDITAVAIVRRFDNPSDSIGKVRFYEALMSLIDSAVNKMPDVEFVDRDVFLQLSTPNYNVGV